MRNYSPMRIPPMADPVTRSETRRLNDWLRQLGPLLGRTVTLPQGTPSAVTQNVDLGNYLYLPGRQDGQISYGRVRFAAKVMPAGGTSVPDTAQNGLGLLSQSTVDGPTSANFWIEESSASLPKRPTREWVFPAFNEVEGETAGIHYFVDTADYQKITNKTFDQGNRHAFGFNTGTGLLNGDETKLCHLSLEGLSGNRNATTHAITFTPPATQIPPMDVQTGIGTTVKDRTHTFGVVRTPLVVGIHSGTPFEIGAPVFGGDTQKELYSMAGAAKGTYPGPSQGNLMFWNPTVSFTGDVGVGLFTITNCSTTTGMVVGMRVRDTRVNTAYVERWIVSIDSGTQITVTESFSETTSGISFSAFGPNWAGAGAIDHGALGGLTDDDHAQYLLLAGRTGGQVIGAGAHTGGNSTDLAIEGNIIVGDDISALNFTAGRLFQGQVNAVNNASTFQYTSDLTALSGAASGTINLFSPTFTGNPGWTSGSAVIRGLNFNAVIAPQTGVTLSTFEGGRFQASTGSGAGTITTYRGLAIQLSGGTGGPGTTTAFNGIDIAMANSSTPVTTARGILMSRIGVISTAVGTANAIEVATTFFADTDVTLWQGLVIPAISGPATVRGLVIGTTLNQIAGRLQLGSATDPSHYLDIAAGTTTVAPIRLTSATPITTAVAGCLEFLTDDFFATITTGAARKAFVLDDGTRLTSGRVPFATTNGRLIDDADMTFATDTLTVTKLIGSTSITASNLTSGRVVLAGAAGILTDDADLTFSTDTLTTTKIVVGGGASIDRLDHGVYTPTLTNVANLDASTAYQCQWMRVGTVVTVSGKVDIDPTLASVATQLGISLPVASNFGAEEDCGGTAAPNAVIDNPCAIRADAANDRAELNYVNASVANHAMFFSFTYRII